MTQPGSREWVHFVVRYQDGRSTRMRVQRFVLKALNNAVLTIARDRQERGELPSGLIASIERVFPEVRREV